MKKSSSPPSSRPQSSTTRPISPAPKKSPTSSQPSSRPMSPNQQKSTSRPMSPVPPSSRSGGDSDNGSRPGTSKSRIVQNDDDSSDEEVVNVQSAEEKEAEIQAAFAASAAANKVREKFRRMYDLDEPGGVSFVDARIRYPFAVERNYNYVFNDGLLKASFCTPEKVKIFGVVFHQIDIDDPTYVEDLLAIRHHAERTNVEVDIEFVRLVLNEYYRKIKEVAEKELYDLQKFTAGHSVYKRIQNFIVPEGYYRADLWADGSAIPQQRSRSYSIVQTKKKKEGDRKSTSSNSKSRETKDIEDGKDRKDSKITPIASTTSPSLSSSLEASSPARASSAIADGKEDERLGEVGKIIITDDFYSDSDDASSSSLLFPATTYTPIIEEYPFNFGVRLRRNLNNIGVATGGVSGIRGGVGGRDKKMFSSSGGRINNNVCEYFFCLANDRCAAKPTIIELKQSSVASQSEIVENHVKEKHWGALIQTNTYS